MGSHEMTRRGALALFGTSALALGGCVSLPSTSAPKVIDTFSPRASQVDVPAPTPDQEPDLLVRDFIKASSLADRRHAAARQFLTPAAAESWDYSASMTVVLRVDLNAVSGRTAEKVTYTLRADRVGEIEEGGVFTARDGEQISDITLIKVDGQWRIDELPPGVVMERTDFYSNFSSHDLYFFDPANRSLVPDPRWSSTYRDDLAFALLNLVVAGPRPTLEGAVSSRLPDTVAVRPAQNEEGSSTGTTIDFQNLPPMTSDIIEQFAAQVVWTLAHAEIPGPYLLESGGAPIDQRHAAGWTVEDVKDFDPNPEDEPLGLALTSADGVVRLTGQAAQRIGGAWSGIADTRYARLSPSGTRLALVAGDGANPDDTVLSVGTLEERPTEILRGRNVTAPTWNRVDDSLWFLSNGRISRLANVNDPATAAEVGQEGLGALPGPISDMALDPTGVRLFFVAGNQSFMSTVLHREGQSPALGPVRRIGQGLTDTVTSVGWRDRDTVMVGRTAVEAPVVTISVDGSLTESMSGRNISAPINAVAASGATLYALDQRALLQLDASADEGARYWRELPGLSGIRAFPVVRG